MMYGNPPRIRSSWNTDRMLFKGLLTDRKIKKYQEKGWYSAEFREARRKLMEKKRIENHVRRVGNFFESDGRLIYSPA